MIWILKSVSVYNDKMITNQFNLNKLISIRDPNIFYIYYKNRTLSTHNMPKTAVMAT